MEYREIIGSCYCGDGIEKLSKASELAHIYAESLPGEASIQKQLAQVRTAVTDLDDHMGAMEMGKTCSACAAMPKGGCCSAYMGHENTDALLLLMNILAGVDVKRVCDNEVECGFLGTSGCILLFKPIFCLNYLCGRIQEKSDMLELKKLEQKTGALLTAQSDLEQLLIRFLQLQE